VIGQRADAFGVEPLGGLLDLPAAQAIDDAALPRPLREEALQLALRIVLLDDGVADVRTVEARREDARIVELQPVDEIVARLRIGRRRQRHARHAGEAFPQHGELEIFRPEVVAPLADAMGLVDGEEADPDACEQSEKSVADKTLGRHIEEIEIALRQRDADVPGFLRRQRGVERRRPDARLPERLHLVAHQGDEGRDDDARAFAAERRDLVAERLARARRQQHHGVAAPDEVPDDLFLLAAEGRQAEDLLQHPFGIGRSAGRQRLEIGHETTQWAQGSRAQGN